MAVGETSWTSTLFTLEFLVTLFSADFVHLTLAFGSTRVQQLRHVLKPVFCIIPLQPVSNCLSNLSPDMTPKSSEESMSYGRPV